jgi:hypothetical protein
MRRSKGILSVCAWLLVLAVSLPVSAQVDGPGLGTTNTDVASMAHFKLSGAYVPGQFADVDERYWYGYERDKVISTAFELGLMQGKGTGFDPDGGVTLAEAVTLSARVHHIYHGGDGRFPAGTPWYKPYADYAVAQGIIGGSEFTDLTRRATRAETAHLFARALPRTAYPLRNEVNVLPDVTADTPYADSIFLLYRAGVLSGSDPRGTFRPADRLTRVEAAAIIARVALPEARRTFILDPPLPAPTPAPTPESPSVPEAPGDETPDGSDNDSAASDYPLWEEVYTPWMRIDTLEAYYDLIVHAARNLVTHFEVMMSPSVRDEEDENPDATPWYGYCETAYDSSTLEFRYQVTYHLNHLMHALIYNREVVLPHASEEARGYDTAMQAIRSQIFSPDMTDEQKIKAAHDYIVATYRYDLGENREITEEERHTFVGLLKHGTGVCEAYMEMFYYLMRYENIECVKVYGEAPSPTGEYGLHAWNVVYVNDGYYHVDTTFDDPVPDQGPVISYDYYLKTDDEMAKTHVW